MRLVAVLAVVFGCSQPAPVQHDPAIGNEGSSASSSGSNAAADPAACTTDADCTIGYAGPECCTPDGFCGAVVSHQQVEAFGERCKAVRCRAPQPSSSCMGWMNVTAVCKAGRCARSDE